MKFTLVKQRLPLPAGQNLALILAGLVLGLTLAVRWQDVGAQPADGSGARVKAAQALTQLEREQEQLKARVAQLRDELTAAQKQASKNTELLTRLSAELEQERMVAGLVPLTGPGVVVALDDSKLGATVTGAAAEDYMVHEYDLRDVVNLLWAGGAEAIAINDERLVSTTSIYCAGSTIMVNDTRLSPPYEVRAIGDRAPLQSLLEDPASLPELRPRIKSYGVQFRVSWPNQVDIPPYSGTFNLRYVHAGEATP